MKTIKEPEKSVVLSIPPQQLEKDIKYVESPYLIKEDRAIFNSLSGEIVIVEDITKDKNDLIKRWFYVPEGFDTSSLCHIIRQRNLLSLKNNNLKGSYIIFTTTACNASCEYCFEKGFDILTMDEKTANDVADYIIRTHNPSLKAIYLKWFGGEPLVNKAAINIICDRLKKAGVCYYSSIFTNGDLLPRCSDDEFKLWKIRQVQLTVDDTEDDYSRIKGLPSNAYDNLKTSIKRLEDFKIKVSLRIHYNPVKGTDACYKIIDDLKKYPNVSLYIRSLYGEHTKEEYEEVLKLEDYITHETGKTFTIPKVNLTSHCMADNPSVACITPKGELSPCEHYAYGKHMYGSIYSSEVNRDVLDKWSIREKHLDSKCKQCPLYPSCRKITMCETEGSCSDGYLYYQLETIKRYLRNKIGRRAINKNDN